jgi:hypothetical protein
LAKFQNFEKLQTTRNHVELDGYCKYSLLFVKSIRKTPKTRKSQDSFQKISFRIFSWKWSYLLKLEIWRLLPRQCYILCLTIHYIEVEWIWDIFKSRVFLKKANTPPLTKFQNFDKIHSVRNHVELDRNWKNTLVFVRSIGKTPKTRKTQDLFQENSFFQNFFKWN